MSGTVTKIEAFRHLGNKTKRKFERWMKRETKQVDWVRVEKTLRLIGTVGSTLMWLRRYWPLIKKLRK